MFLPWNETWFTLEDEWNNYNFDINNCQSEVIYEITQENIIDDTDTGVCFVNADNCFNKLILLNTVMASQILLNFQNHTIQVSQILEVLGMSANVTLISSNEIHINNLTYVNIPFLTFITGKYVGLDNLSEKILYNNSVNTIYIKDLHGDSLRLAGGKILLAGEIDSIRFLTLKLHGVNNPYFNLDASQLQAITAYSINIEDQSQNGTGIHLAGEIKTVNFILKSSNFLQNGTILTKILKANVQNITELVGYIHGTNITIVSNLIKINKTAELTSSHYSLEGKLYKAGTIRIAAIKNLWCEESAKIFSGNDIYITAEENLYFNGIAESLHNINFGGGAVYKEFGTESIIISYKGNVFGQSSKHNDEMLIFKGFQLAKEGSIEYISQGSIDFEGIIVSNNGIKFKAKTFANFSASNEKAKFHLLHYMNSTDNTVISLLTFESTIEIEAEQGFITFNKNTSVINNSPNIQNKLWSGKIILKSGTYIFHSGNITATGDIIENAFGEDYNGFGLILNEDAVIQSVEGEYWGETPYNIKLAGSVGGNKETLLNARCMETSNSGIIFSIEGNSTIHLSKCTFLNHAALYSNQTLTLTVNGGHV